MKNHMIILLIVTTLLVFGLVAIIIYQRTRIKSLKKRRLRKLEWHVNVSSGIKELFIYNFSLSLLKKNINIKDVMDYFNDSGHTAELEEVTISILENRNFKKLHSRTGQRVLRIAHEDGHSKNEQAAQA
ncbi:MAG: hypothetical protein ACJAU8_000278 [Candidatus Paceibacteria bacterium]|jgi:uncharacterized protein YebE (UPF0316 family)